MRVLLVLLLVAACAVPGTEPSTGDLGEVAVRTVTVDGAPLTVAVAATSDERSRGLRGVDDLGDLDGMLFVWDGDTVTSRFTMAGTLIDLDIAFFDPAGRFVDGFRMPVCDVEPCPTYAASAPYAYALETPAGTGPAVGPGSVLDLGR
ncbi:MAG: DUF192 domain-containing protein [Acidimicrobiia bacterium]